MTELINKPEFDSYRYAQLQRGHDFGMKLDGGKSAFGKVLDYEQSVQIAYRYGSLATKTCISSYAGGSTTTWNQWTDRNGHKIFREMQDQYILQIFVGIWPRQLRWWFQYPSGNTHGNLSEIMVDTPAVIGTGGYLDGLDSPFEDPSRRSEIMVPKEMQISHMIYNPTLVTVMPSFKVIIRRCRVKWYNYKNPQDAEAIQGFADFIHNNNKARPVHYYSPGVENFTYGIEQQLNVPPVDTEALAGVTK